MLSLCLLWMERLIGLALLLQSLEYISLKKAIEKIWGWNPAPLHQFRVALCLVILILPDFVFLPHGYLLLLMVSARSIYKFQGPFNGGSDYMSLLVLAAVTLAEYFPTLPLIQMFSLGYIMVQLILSYFVSGVAKAKNKKWRSGQVLKNLLNSDFCQIPVAVKLFFARYNLYRLASVSVILFEILWLLVLGVCVVPGAGQNLSWLLAMMAAGIVFHCLNFYILGLNRFFFAWIAAYPALVYFCVR